MKPRERLAARRARWWWTVLPAVGLGAALGSLAWLADPLLAGAGLLLLTFAGLLRQRSARRATERLLHERETLLRAVVDGALDAIMTVDALGAVASFNLAAERMFGWPSKEIIGQAARLLFTPEPGAADSAARHNPVRAGAREVLAQRRDGSIFPVHLTCSEAPVHGKRVVTAIARDLTQYRQAAEALQVANALLETKVVELEERTRVITLLGQMSDLLQSVPSLAEAYASIADYAKQLFPLDSGALCAVDAEKELVEVVACWGAPASRFVFASAECQALRSGRLFYALNSGDPAAICPHASCNGAAGHACMPITSQGEPIAIVCFGWHAAGRGADAASTIAFRTRLAAAFAEQVSLALTNLRLKQMLRGQAIHDPLTGLHNRRFLEEVFHRELLRGARRRSPVGVLMLDLDHFKDFNDAHGHVAGDNLLRAFAVQLRSDVRAEDIVCRYGGEEFAVILPDTTLAQSTARADQIRDGMRKIVIDIGGRQLQRQTVSIGVAGWPEHGASPDALLRAADAALYAAKGDGRDRTRLAAQLLEPTAAQPDVNLLTGT